MNIVLTVIAAPPAETPKLPADLLPLFSYPVRDTCICPGPDGVFYLTGTTGHPTWWQTNEGIRIWKSKDLTTWEPLGLVWSLKQDATWQKPKVGHVAVWAPELHYFKGNFWLAYCLSGGGTGILRSKTGKAEGPYEDVKQDGPLTGDIDASLFADDDGSVYFVWQNGRIARLKDNLSGLAEEPRLLKPANAGDVGFEGAFLTKINGRYHLICANFNKTGKTSTYDCMSASADSIYGPYGDRYLAIPHGGHNVLFKGPQGKWWSTFFGNDPLAPFTERAAMLRIHLDEAGRIASACSTSASRFLSGPGPCAAWRTSCTISWTIPRLSMSCSRRSPITTSPRSGRRSSSTLMPSTLVMTGASSTD